MLFKKSACDFGLFIINYCFILTIKEFIKCSFHQLKHTRVIDLFCLVHEYRNDEPATNMEGIQDGGHMAEETISHLRQIASSSILDSFSKLESDVENCRVAAGVVVLRNIYQKQCESEAEVTCMEVNYALKRLIRGLGTSNPSKRAGFFSVFVEMLNLFPTITVQDVIGIMNQELEPASDSSKKEITEIYSAQILVIGALIHSNIILKESDSLQAEILGKLIAAGQRKNILSPSVFCFIIDFVHKSNENHFREVLWPVLKPEVNRSWEQHTLDTFHLLIVLRKKFPEVVKKKFLLHSLGNKEVINTESIAHCAKLLMSCSVENHPVYMEVFELVRVSNLIFPFWESLVKENESRRSHNRDQALLKFFELLLQMSDKSQIPDLLNDSFMRFIVKTLEMKKINANLAQNVGKLFTKMSDLLENGEMDDDVKVLFVQRLLFYPGHLMFDKLAGTKIVLQLSSHMKIKAIEKIGKMLRNVIRAKKPKVMNAQGETSLWTKWERSYAVQLFTRLLSHPVVEENIEWKLKQLEFLISVGLVAPQSREPGDIVNNAISNEVRNCIFKVLDQKVSKVSKLVLLLKSIAHHLNSIIYDNKKSSKLRQPLSESALEAWQKVFIVVNELESMDENVLEKKSNKSMFLILFLHMGLQLFQNAPLAEEALQELHLCYERIRNEDEKSEKKFNNNVNDDEPYWVEVIVDLILSLLSRNSHLLRNIVGVIFPHLCSYMTPTAVHQILQVLNPYGKQPLSNTDTEGEDESEDDNSDKETESGSDEEDDDVEDESGDTPVDAHLKLAVQNALKKAGGGYGESDEESVDMDAMTEDQMNGLDAALSEAFKLIKHNQADQKRKKQSRDDETLMHFRERVLDLIDMYLTTQPALALVLDIILPLFELLEFCIRDDHQKPLENRVRCCIKKLASVKHFSDVNGVDQELLSIVLGRLLQKGERAAAVYQNMGGPLVQCSTFLAKTSCYLAQKQNENSSKKASPVLSVFEEALTTFFKQRDSLLPLEVFRSVLAISWNGSWGLAAVILEFAFDVEVRQFRRHQAVELLLAFFSNGHRLADMTPKLIKKLEIMEKKLSENTIKTLNQLVYKRKNGESSTDVKEKYVKDIFRLLFTIWNTHKRYQENGVHAAIDWEAVKIAVSQFWDVVPLKLDTKGSLKKLAAALQISLKPKGAADQKKLPREHLGLIAENERNDGRKEVKENHDSKDENENCGEPACDTDEDTGDKGYESGNDDKEPIQEDTKKRKKKKVDNLKGKAILKKQTKETRLATMADGLDGSFSFTCVNLEELSTVDENVKTEKKVKRNKKRSFSDEDNYVDELSVISKTSKKPKAKRKEAIGTLPKQKKHKLEVN